MTRVSRNSLRKGERPAFLDHRRLLHTRVVESGAEPRIAGPGPR
jgi:hypothetical protein